MKKKPTILESEIIDKVLVIFTAIWLCHECSAASRFRYEPSSSTVNFGKNIDGNSHDPCGYTKHILCKYNQTIMRNIFRFCVAALFFDTFFWQTPYVPFWNSSMIEVRMALREPFGIFELLSLDKWELKRMENSNHPRCAQVKVKYLPYRFIK